MVQSPVERIVIAVAGRRGNEGHAVGKFVGDDDAGRTVWVRRCSTVMV